MTISLFALLIIVMALLFDFLNGFHDAANSIATIVVTRTLTPAQAVLMAGAANFVGYFVFGVAIANMVGKGIIDSQAVTLTILFPALLGAVLWNILTWLLGLPTSSSHALIGGLVGSGFAAAGAKVILFKGLFKVFLFIFLAPAIGMAGAIVVTMLVILIVRNMNRRKTNARFKKLQLVAAVFSSIGHGTNDAQKTMGIIALTLLASGVNKEFRIDTWVALACQSAIALGTIFGGWRIVKTMGTNITKIGPMEGFCSSASAAVVMIGTAHFGIPVSTTHVIAGSIMGVGTVERAHCVRWVTARRIVWAWFLTIPLTALVSAACYGVISLFRF
jgi:inorganic phosphate transporter, PiT family